MAGGLPGGAQWVERTTPEMVIEKMMAERRKLDRETRLTWTPGKPPSAPLDRVVGDVNLSLPYMKIVGERPGQYYFIQNARYFRSNGQETTIEDISKEASDITVHYLIEAYKIFIRDAQERDPALCKICLKFRADSYEQYATHMIQEHPSAVMGKLGLDADAEPVPPPVKIEEKATEPAGFTCCNKTFKNKQAILAHKRFGHKAG